MVLALVCACSSKTTTTTGGGGTGDPKPPGASCDGARKKIEQLYRADADANKEKPERVEEAVADNTTMVMNDCAKNPGRVVACINRVRDVAELEKTCLVQLDDEGTDGEALRK
jgi:hypothetical protein